MNPRSRANADCGLHALANERRPLYRSPARNAKPAGARATNPSLDSPPALWRNRGVNCREDSGEPLLSAEEATLVALRAFADSVKGKAGALSHGEPEDQLRKPLEVLLETVGQAINVGVVCKGETLLPGRLGRPDYAVHAGGVLAGYVELKAPGADADPRHFRGRDARQWKRFQALPNLLYSDGNEWSLWREGELVRPIVRLERDVSAAGGKAVAEEHARALLDLLRDFLAWEPVVPRRAGELADLLAPLCKMLREDVLDALRAAPSPLERLARDWRQMLFPEADDARFADAYAQTVTFALLLARSEGAFTLDIHQAVARLAGAHSLLSRALLVLTDAKVEQEISASLHLLQRVVNAIPAETFARQERDPWLYFYEEFLGAYDPLLRKNAGVYYTPVQVVQAQVRLIDELLRERLGKPHGFADADVVTLDPAVGTGTYLLGVIEHALGRIEGRQGAGAVPGRATALARNLFGFEIMVGPFAVSELRVSRALQERGAALPDEGIGVYLTDTLESPNAQPAAFPQFLEPLADQHKRALRVKDKVPVLVCLGNPPYDRHEAADPKDERTRAKTGGWVRWGDDGDPQKAILRHFIQPAVEAGHGGDVKNLYNLYVYFWRWALWKVFEQKGAMGPGVVSFISASSYLTGDAFAGMREHLRRLCDEIWIIDLGGEGRGARQSENVFDIRTPVAIAIAACYGKPNREKPATVHYTSVEGTRTEKLAQLAAIGSFSGVAWQRCPAAFQAPFHPASDGRFFDWPLLTGIFPWQHSGVQLKRTWPIAPEKQTLERRWRALLRAADMAEAFRETEDRRVDRSYHVGLTEDASATPIGKLPKDAPPPPVQRYAYRSFDRQFILADGRLMSRPRPPLWQAMGEKQVFLTSILTLPLGPGPALVACAQLPDLHFFAAAAGGGKDVIPLYRDRAATQPNVAGAALEIIRRATGLHVNVEDLAAYLYAVLAHPCYASTFAKELGRVEVRVPITKDAATFRKARAIGRRLLWLHTYGERFVPAGKQPGVVPAGKARCTGAVPGDPELYPDTFAYDEATRTLRVGEGEFAPVEKTVWEFQVSGLEVVKSWLRYRMKSGYGRKSSPLDGIRPERWTEQFTTELLELLWVLEATLAEYPSQAELLDEVLRGPLFRADDFPPVPAELRKAPKPIGHPELPLDE